MTRRTAQLIAGALILCAWLVTSGAAPSAEPQHRRTPTRSRAAANARDKQPPALPCGDLLSFQVLLDRQGVSPGEIDGMSGNNLTHALAAFQQAHRLPMTGRADCDTWRALAGEGTASSATLSYTIAADDVKGPFTPAIPKELVAQAELPELGYRSALEKLGERFHAAPALLRRLNHASRFAPGDVIQVPAVQPFDPDAKPVVDPAAMGLTIQVTRDESAVRATQADGTLVFFAPVT